MTAKIIVRREMPVDAVPAKFLPQFQSEFDDLNTITAAGLQPLSTYTSPIEVVNGVKIYSIETTFNTVAEAVASSNIILEWKHDNIIAYNKEQNILTFNKIIDLDTDEVIQDWTQR